MRTIICLFRLSLISVFLTLAYQSQAQRLIFDGKDDYAFIAASNALKLNKSQDFTFEFFINSGTAPKQGMSLLSIHDGKKGIVCAIDREGIPYLLIDGKSYKPEEAVISDSCGHLVYMQKGGTLYTVIDGVYHQMGTSTSVLSTHTDVVIGNSPNTSESFYSGSIDEIRLWKTYRTDEELEIYRNECLIGNQEGLMAHWNIAETSGQFANDLVGNLHARWGNNPTIDVADPSLEESVCKEERCCEMLADFTIEGEGSQYTFVNLSNVGNYTWYIDGIVVSNTRDLNHVFQLPGEYLITMEALAKNGCKSKRTVWLTVDFDTAIAFCDGYEKTYDDSAPFNENNFYYDRFGNRYTANEIAISANSPAPANQLQTQSLRSLSAPFCDCQTDFGINTNHFELYFEDCELGTGTGFDDPTVSGSSTFGRERRRTVCQVYADLSQKILQNNTTCGVASDKVRVKVMPSQANNYYPDGTNLPPLSSSTGGVASAFTMSGLRDGIMEVLPWLVLNSGADQNFNYSTSIYHGFIRINFSNFTSGWHIGQTLPVPANEVDLYTVTLHETMHMLGMGSNLLFDGSNWQSRITGNSIGGYSRWDSHIKRASGTLDVITNASGYAWDLNPALSLPGDLLNSCNGTDLWIGNNQAPLFSGNLSNYSPGASLSHLDENCISGSSFVLNPTISAGQDKRTLSATEEQLFSDLGYQVAGNINCTVVGVDDVYGNCSKTFIVSSCPGSSLNISTADLIANDINATGATQVELITTVGALQTVVPGSNNSDYIFTPLVNRGGDYILRYKPIGCNGQIGNTTYFTIEVLDCINCEFADVSLAQTTNSFIVDNGPNCGTTPTAGKCVDCGYNKNPANLICNPEMCADETNLDAIRYSHYQCNPATQTQLPGWFKAISTPGYVSSTLNNSLGTPLDYFPDALHQNNGYMHMAMSISSGVVTSIESVYTNVDILPSKRYLFSVYGNASKVSNQVRGQSEVYLLANGFNAAQEFACLGHGYIPYILASQKLSVLNWAVTEHYLLTGTANNYPFERNGSFVNVPAGYHTSKLLFTNKLTYLSGTPNATINYFMDHPEMVEDDFTAGDDQSMTCGIPVVLGGTDFGMLSDVKTQYTWTNVTNGNVEGEYWVEREIDGTFTIFDMVNATFVNQIPTISVTPAVTSSYRLTRSFIPDTDGTFGGMPANIFNGIPLTDDVQVIVPAGPAANPTFTHTVNCNTVDFISDPATLVSPFSHSWDIDGDGVFDYFISNPSHSYAFNGTYQVVHEVSNGCGTFTTSQAVNVSANTLLVNVTSGNPGPLIQGDLFNASVTVENIGTAPINNIVVELPVSLATSGLSYSTGPYNIASLNAGQSTVIAVPVTVTGICGTAQVCAEVTNADNACLIPPVCSAPMEIQTNLPLNQALSVSNTITTTYPAPYVVGGLVEFDVQVNNLSTNAISAIDLDLTVDGVELITSLPANFTLAAGASNTLTFIGKVLDCEDFLLETDVLSAAGTCPGVLPNASVSGQVTPYTITVSAPDLTCANGSGIQASVSIVNPSNQTITDVSVLPTGASNLFQNFIGSLSNLTLTPNSTTTTPFTFDTNGNSGTAFICAAIETIGTGINEITYSCDNRRECIPVEVKDNAYTVTLTSVPTNGSDICLSTGNTIDYQLEITNNLGIPLNLTLNHLMNGMVLASGQVIPSNVSISANSSSSYNFTTSINSNAIATDISIDVISGLAGCSVVSVNSNNTIKRDINSVLQISSVMITPTPFVNGQWITMETTITNLSSLQVNDILVSAGGGSTPLPLFDLPGNSSVVKTITVRLNACFSYNYRPTIVSTSSTCNGSLAGNGFSVNGTMQRFQIGVMPVSYTCAGGTAIVEVRVNNPSASVIPDMVVNLSGAATGSILNGLGLRAAPPLMPGWNTFFLNVNTNSGASGTESLCVSIAEVGGATYTCPYYLSHDCEPITVGDPLDITIGTNSNQTGTCPGDVIDFTVDIENKYNTPLTVNLNNVLSGAVLNSGSLSGSVTINAGATQNLVYPVTVNNSGLPAELTVNTSISGVAPCNTNRTESLLLPILPDINQAVSVTSNMTSTFSGPHVIGALAEYSVTVTNNLGVQLNNIDLDYTSPDLVEYNANPSNFSLPAFGSQTFTVQGRIATCGSFDFVAAVVNADGYCGNIPASATLTDTSVPLTISVNTPDVVCMVNGFMSATASVTINNPGNQLIPRVRMNYNLGGLFQTFNGSQAFAMVQPGANPAIVNYGFYNNTNGIGTDQICFEITEVNYGTFAGNVTIPYNCAGATTCSTTTLISNSVSATLTANPTDGTTVCIGQNDQIDYTLTINNPNATPVNNVIVNSVLSGATLNAGQTIPSAVNLAANGTQIYNFSATANSLANSADLQIDLPAFQACTPVSVSISNPIMIDINQLLQVSTIPLTTGVFAKGQQVSYEVTVTNLSGNAVNNIDLNYQSAGLTNVTLSPSNFNLGGSASTTYLINATVDDCATTSFTAELLSANQTCVPTIPTSGIQTNVVDYQLQINAPAVVCAGATEIVTIVVDNPSNYTIPNVSVALTGNLIPGGQLVQTVNLPMGQSTLTYTVNTVSGMNSLVNLCASITQINGDPFSCLAANPCASMQIVDTPLAISIQQLGNSVLCGDGTASFDVTVTNQSGIALNGIDFALSGNGTDFIPGVTLPASVNIPAGGVYNFTLSGQVGAGVSALNFCLDVVSIANLPCMTSGTVQGCVSNVPVNSMTLPIEIEDAITGPSGSLSLEVIYDMTLGDDGFMYAVGVMRDSQVTIQGGGSNTYTAANNCVFGINSFVLKYDNTGVSWFKTIDACAIATGVAVDASGEVFVALNTLSDLSFAGGTHTLQGWYDFAILRYDAAGNEMMFHAEGGDGIDYAADIKVNNGKIIVTGSAGGIDPAFQGAGYNNQYSLGGQAFTYNHYVYQQNNTALGDGFTVSYLYNGLGITNDWVDVITAPLVPNKIAMEPNGNIYVIGAALETFTFPHITPGGGGQLAVNSLYAGGIPAATSQPNVNIDIDAFIVSYASNGNKRWGRLYGSSALDYPETVADMSSNNNFGSLFHQTDIRFSASGQLYAALQSQATVTGTAVSGSVLSFQTQMGSHIVNLNPADGSIGINEWSVPAASPVSTTISSTVNGATYSSTLVGNTVFHPNLAVDNNDQIYLTGTYYLSQNYHQSVDFYSAVGGPAPLQMAAGGFYEIGLVTEKFDQNGNFVWAEPNRSWIPYTGPYHPTLTPGNNPLRPMDLEVNACGIYQTLLMDGSLDVGGVTYTAAPYDAYIFRIREGAGGLIYGRTEAEQVTIQPNIIEEVPLGLTIYPNPNRGRFTVSVSGDQLQENSRILIYHMNGVLVKTIEVKDAMQQELDFSDQNSGMYFVKLINGDEVITRSVVVQR